MNQSKNYVPPSVEIYRVIMEANIAQTPTSYKMDISGNVKYEDYEDVTSDLPAPKYVIISY
jgi:hypothetical protein